MYPLLMIKLNFPFFIEDEKKVLEVESVLERKENVVTFCLEYQFNIQIDRANLVSIIKHNTVYLYVFEFDSINDAIDFEQSKECDVNSGSFFSDPKDIEKEIVEFAESYMKSGGQKKKNKKRLVEDENGFQRYI